MLVDRLLVCSGVGIGALRFAIVFAAEEFPFMLELAPLLLVPLGVAAPSHKMIDFGSQPCRPLASRLPYHQCSELTVSDILTSSPVSTVNSEGFCAT